MKWNNSYIVKDEVKKAESIFRKLVFDGFGDVRCREATHSELVNQRSIQKELFQFTKLQS